MKLYPPFGNVTYWLTQTTHGESATVPADLSKQKAEDWSAVAGTAVYAGADGKIVNSTSSAGAYLTLDIGAACPFWILYVHCKAVAGIGIGTVVKRGQKIATTVDPYGHLHLGFKNKNYKAPHPEPMDYIDRTIAIKTRYTSIAKLWFPGGMFNWSLFADRQLPGTDVVPPVDPCVARLAAQAKTYEEQIATMKAGYDTRLQAEAKQLDEISTRLKHIIYG